LIEPTATWPQAAEEQDRDLLDAYDATARNGSGHAVGIEIDAGETP
jgi:hypothetical protein